MTFPGVSIEEVPSGPGPIVGAPTSVAGFVGRARRGPTAAPRLIRSPAEFVRVYGGPWEDGPLGHAVEQFFGNGGAEAVIARVHHGAAAATLTLPTAVPGTPLGLMAVNEGSWGNSLQVHVRATAAGEGFDLEVRDADTLEAETHTGLFTDPASPRFVATALAASELVRVFGDVPAAAPLTTTPVLDAAQPGPAADPWAGAPAFSGGDDGAPLTDADLSDPALEPVHRGLWLLDAAPDLNLLCIPPLGPAADVGRQTWDAAVRLATARCAVVLVDPPAVWTAGDAASRLDDVVTRHPNAALYAPRLLAPDPRRGGTLSVFAPCGAVAGVIARTDRTLGVWQAPAGTRAELRGVVGLAWADGKPPSPRDPGLNPLGINALLTKPGAGPVVWGARTLAGFDAAGGSAEWRYLPVRRLALFLEESIARWLGWTVFEPNDEPLWARVRTGVGAFLNELFRAGAFLGVSSRDAWNVRCDRSTTTAADLAAGEFTLLVGFAPVKPAEFHVLQIRGRAGGAG